MPTFYVNTNGSIAIGTGCASEEAHGRWEGEAARSRSWSSTGPSCPSTSARSKSSSVMLDHRVAEELTGRERERWCRGVDEGASSQDGRPDGGGRRGARTAAIGRPCSELRKKCSRAIEASTIIRVVGKQTWGEAARENGVNGSPVMGTKQWKRRDEIHSIFWPALAKKNMQKIHLIDKK